MSESLPKRQIDFIGIHCTASDNPKDDNYQALKELHTSPKDNAIQWGKYKTWGRAWSDIGYNYFIVKSGDIHKCRPESKVGAHIRGHNSNSLSICLSGDKDFTEEQRKSFVFLVDQLLGKYNLDLKDIVAHYELDPKKTCPNFNPVDFYRGN